MFKSSVSHAFIDSKYFVLNVSEILVGERREASDRLNMSEILPG